MQELINGVWMTDAEWSAQLGVLWGAMRSRYDPPPADEAHLWSEGICDWDLTDGTTWHGIKCWQLIEPYEAWARLRWPERSIWPDQPMPPC